MLEFFREFRIAQESFVRNLARVCRAATAKYNRDPCNYTKIEKCRINVNTWGPNEGKLGVDIQVWIAGGYPKMSEEEVEEILETFEGILGKDLFCQKGFELECYIENVTIPSDDD